MSYGAFPGEPGVRAYPQRFNTCLQRRMDHWGELRIVIRGMVGIIDRLLRSDNAARGTQRSYTILQFVIRACRSLT